VKAKKSLGQHWLTDTQALEAIAEAAEIRSSDTVLEIGPGLGHLTHYLLEQSKHVVAVELDAELAAKLAKKYAARNLSVHTVDILKFDLSNLPDGYKVVANIPYYLTSNLLRTLAEAANHPRTMVLLVQKEVAARIAARPGEMSLLSVSVQLYYEVELGVVVPAKLFEPPPKIDSQVIILRRHAKPLFHDLDIKKFFRVVKAGFSERRKKLRSSLAGGLGLSREQVDELLAKAGMGPDSRAQEVSLEQWYKLYQIIKHPAP